MGVLGHISPWDIFCPLGYIWTLGHWVLGHFRLKKLDKKIDEKVHKDFELYQVFMCQTVLIFFRILDMAVLGQNFRQEKKF